MIFPILAGPASAVAPGVTGYPPACFADAAPSIALDMVKRLPGGAYDAGKAETASSPPMAR